VPSSEIPYKVTIAVLLILMETGRLIFGGIWWRRETKTQATEKGLPLLEAVLWLAAIATFAYLVTPWLDGFRLPFPPWLRWTGAVISLIGVVLFVWAHRALGRFWSPMLEIQPDHRLVTTGPYRHVRHPMYSTFFVICIGLSITSANWIVAVTWFGGFAVILRHRIPDEERMMIDEFGDEYREYMRHTGRLIPRMRG